MLQWGLPVRTMEKEQWREWRIAIYERREARMREVGTTGPGAGETVSGTFEGGCVQLDQVRMSGQGERGGGDAESDGETQQTQPRRNAEAFLGRATWSSNYLPSSNSCGEYTTTNVYAGKSTPR